MPKGREADTDRFPEYVWIAQNLVRLRLEAGLSQGELADRLWAGVDQSFISAIERMRINATLEVLSQIARALGVSLGELVSPPRGET